MDVKCVKCGEPWDTYGLSHGDVCAWEADMIRHGIGCPVCKGEKRKELTLFEHIENETALEGRELIEGNSDYGKPLDYIQLCKCEECGDGYSVDVDYIYYDGNQTIMHGAVGSIRLDNKLEIERNVCYAEGWARIDGKLICKNCFDKYTECDGCGLMTHESESFYLQEYQKVYCEDCYGNETFCCEDCGQVYLAEDATNFEDKDYCPWCLEEYTTECEICKTRFEKNNIIYGKNDEVCCSEKCADATTEI